MFIWDNNGFISLNNSFKILGVSTTYASKNKMFWILF